MNTKNIITIIIVVIVAAGIITFGILSKPKQNPADTNPSAPISSETPQNPGSSTSEIPTRVSAPTNVVVPEQGAKDAPKNVAVPETVIPVMPGSTSKNRTFSVSAENNKFIPDTIAVNVGDNINIKMTAVDKDYDFSQPDYGIVYPVPKGQTKTIIFQVSGAGKFTFFCSACGGPDKGPIGYIIVK